MKLECAGCSARYSIDAQLIPAAGAKLKCRKCGNVITIPPPAAMAPEGSPLIPPSPSPATAPPSLAPAQATAPALVPNSAGGFSFFPNESGMIVAPDPPAAPLAPAPRGAASASASAPPVPPAPPAAPAVPAAPSIANAPAALATPVPEGLAPEEKARHEKARRLARVLASDIAIYNKEKKDRGLSEGNLVAVLGYEIKKSWEIYKERVGADFANSTPYFRDALNDLLAEGKKIF
jgi:predicted Zn finger-like uncharacterized protein